MTAALELSGVAKRFGPVQALRGADFVLNPGEVHALLGENGAGKSTLMRVAYGLVRPDAGRVAVGGRIVSPRSPRDARRLGLGMVHQHFTSVPALTVAENIALAAWWPVRRSALTSRVTGLMNRVGLALDPGVPASRLGAALKQRLEFLKALAADPTILLLDEPTAALAPADADELLRVVRRFAARGGAAVLITHKLDEALQVADRVTVLRAGRVTLVGPAAEQTPRSLAGAMIGSDGAFPPGPARPAPSPGPTRIRCDAVDLPREDGRGLALKGVGLGVAAGQVVGLAAVEGNGERELLRAVAGMVRPRAGRIEVSGPVAFVPEDRSTEGLIPELDLTANVVLGVGRAAPWLHGVRLDWAAARARTADLLREFGIRAPGPETPAGALSGGNQQKVVIARALELAPRVIVAENPGRGLDVHAARGVWQRLRSAAAGGAAILVYSSDLDELLLWTDRILVAAGGTITEAPPGSGKAEVGALLLGLRSGVPR